MKPEVPERIWAGTGLYYDYVQDWSEGSWGLDGLGVEYIRADHVDALLKAEREKALDASHEYMMNQYGSSPLAHPVDRKRILAFIEKD